MVGVISARAAAGLPQQPGRAARTAAEGLAQLRSGAGSAAADERHIIAVHGQPRRDVGTRTAPMHRHGGGSVAALGQGVQGVGDGVRHKTSDDNDARHGVLGPPGPLGRSRRSP